MDKVQNKTTQKNNESEFSSLAPVLLAVIVIPLALLLWFGNILVLRLSYTSEDEIEHIPPTRWLAAICIPILVVVLGYRKKSLNQSGAMLGFVIGFFLTLSSYCFMVNLLTFFIISSKATKYRSHEKKRIEKDFREGGQRNWIQVICNSGMATGLAVLYILDYGSGELAINFSNNYRASWLSLGILGAIANSQGDTLASELGTVLGGEPYLITTFKKVPKGTNGGVTFGGLVVSFMGGVSIGLAHYLTLLYCVDKNILSISPSQWPLILIGGFAGLFGSLIDSLLGATLQFSGVEKSTGCILEHSGDDIVHISGHQILDNHSVNLLSSVLMGYLTPAVAKLFLS